MTQKLVQIHLNGTDVTSYRNGYVIEELFGEKADVVKIKFNKSITNDITPSEFQTLEIWEGYVTATDKKKFKGILVGDIEEDLAHFTLTAYGNEYRAILADVRKHYKITGSQAGVGSEIFKDLCDESGLNYTASTIQSTGSLLLIKDFLVQGTDAFERMIALADRYNYQFYYKASDDNMYFEPKGFTVNNKKIYLGGVNNNVTNEPKPKRDPKSIVNQVTVNGVFDRVVMPSQFESGDGSTTEFALDFIPDSIQVIVDSVEQIVGKADVLEDSTVDCLLDAANQKITFQAGSIPASGTDNIEIIITRLIETPITVSDETSISSLGYTSSTNITLSDVTNVEDGELIGLKFLEIRKNAFVSMMVKMKPSVIQSSAYEIGQLVYVDDNFYSGRYSGNYVITKIVTKYPETDVELHLGNKEWKTFDLDFDTLMRLKRLEEKFQSTDVLLNFSKQIRNSIALTNYIEVTEECINDSFTASHEINGLVSQGVILDVLNTSSSNWSGNSFFTLSNNSDTDYVQVQTGSLKADWASGSSNSISSTQSLGDLSTYTGASSGDPSQGTVGVWLYCANSSKITSLSLKIGSGASDYTEISGLEYGSSSTYGDETFTLRDGWNYIVFRLTNGTEIGTPDWTSVDYVSFDFTVTGTDTLYLDYFTISKSNYIGLNGVGTRYTTKSTQSTQ